MAKLSYRGRKRLGRGSFALPPKRSGRNKTPKKIKGRYPIHDKAHARAALSRVAQHGTSSEKARVRAAVRRRFPSIKVKGKK
jgi:hypothetical protein